MVEKVSLSEKLSLITEHWAPKIVGEVGDFQVKAAHVQTGGELVDDPSIVPLGIPLIAGAGSISKVMVLSGQARGTLHQAALITAIVVCILIVFVVLRMAPALVARLGVSGQEILSKVLALLTAVIGFQFIINGGTTVINQLLGG